MSAALELAKLRQSAIHSYRYLLRTQKKVFGSDTKTLNEAWNRSRREFEGSRNIQDDFQKLKEKIDEANQISQFLEKNLVQGKLQSETSSKPIFKVKIEKRVEMWDYTKNGRPTCGCC